MVNLDFQPSPWQTLQYMRCCRFCSRQSRSLEVLFSSDNPYIECSLTEQISQSVLTDLPEFEIGISICNSINGGPIGSLSLKESSTSLSGDLYANEVVVYFWAKCKYCSSLVRSDELEIHPTLGNTLFLDNEEYFLRKDNDLTYFLEIDHATNTYYVSRHLESRPSLFNERIEFPSFELDFSDKDRLISKIETYINFR